MTGTGPAARLVLVMTELLAVDPRTVNVTYSRVDGELWAILRYRDADTGGGRRLIVVARLFAGHPDPLLDATAGGPVDCVFSWSTWLDDLTGAPSGIDHGTLYVARTDVSRRHLSSIMTRHG